MEWAKIKNIIILILALLNLFLLALVAVREGRNVRYQDEARTGVLAALEKNGITFLPEEIPADSELSPLSVTRSRSKEPAMAQAILGQAEREDAGGGVRVVYTGAGGSAAFSSDGRFTFELEPLGFALDEDRLEQDSAERLEQLGLQAVLAQTRTDGRDASLLYLQTWEGVPLFSCRITLTYHEGDLLRIEGERLDGTAIPAAGEPLDTPTILLRFLAGMNKAGYICSRIDAMTAGYLSRVSAARPVVQLEPVWRIITDTGVYYVDCLTGDLLQTE